MVCKHFILPLKILFVFTAFSLGRRQNESHAKFKKINPTSLQ